LKTVALSGPSGFLAKNLIKKLKNTFKLKLLTRSEASLIKLKNNYPFCETEIVDWNNIKNIKEKFNNVDIFIHAGAMLPTRATANDSEILKSSLNIIKNLCLSNLKLEKFIFISTLRTCININCNKFSDDTVYNFFERDTQYGRSKFLSEEYLKKNKNFPLIICAPAHIVGSENSTIAVSNDVILNIFNKKLVLITKAKYSIVHVDDVCESLLKIIQYGRDGEKYLIASENPTLEEIVEYIEKFDNIKKTKILIPIFLINFFSLMFEIFNKIFKLKNLPINRSTYYFIKLYRDFEGEKIKNFNIKFKTTNEIIKEIYQFTKIKR
jgi:dihydroflavonol-4-reductase